jgi:hypothetical protein
MPQGFGIGGSRPRRDRLFDPYVLAHLGDRLFSDARASPTIFGINQLFGIVGMQRRHPAN